MPLDQGPNDCCDYQCTQGRNCPIRGQLQTKNGGARIDTHVELDEVYTWLDRLVFRVRLVLLALFAFCVVMVGFYFFG